MVKIDKIYGWCEHQPTQRFENGRIILGGIFKKFDREGNIVSSKETDTMSVGYDNIPMSRTEAHDLMK
ncbi:MAG: hypothetical protein WC208_15895 [Gallionella sp.]|jgi:hypothetical protein